ncbi:MAG TPA: TAT-variant-translocated molybdopterin oxidoreductase [Bacteroidia bacterium]|jgi:molybdopterin-containing oxidoreductase family iron-sulfur binding subunit|nr:TAT-variant-translocated molybdopterin oxidoreductase [Bacteroidia bacterium]
MEKRYWKGVEELNNTPEFVRLRDNEFFEHLPVDEVLNRKAASDSSTTRRDFLKFLGFSVAAASLAACEAPVKKAIPYVVKPEEVTLGIPNYYASTYYDGTDYCSVLVKTREGRPIKIEGNELSSITKGGTNARVQASVLSLYDSARLAGPLAGKKKAEWTAIDAEITKKLADASASGKKIAIVSSSIASPSAKKIVADFIAKYPTAKLVTYDAVSSYGIVKGNEMSFGKAVVPSYRFDNAEVILSFGADFLSSWLSPIEFSRQYGVGRKLRDGKKSMSRHIQVESALSLAGSNADARYKVKPSEQSASVAAVYNKVAALAGGSSVSAGASPIDAAAGKIAAELWAAKGKSVVISGSNDPNEQVLVNAINSMLGNYGSTINLDVTSNLQSSNDAAVAELLGEMNAGQVGAVIFWNTNPVYSMPDAKAFTAALAKVSCKISLADREDETASNCDYVCPDHHWLESWGDVEPYKGYFTLSQPTIRPLFSTRQGAESLMKWAGAAQADYYTYLRDFWAAAIYPMQSAMTSFDAFWTKSLQDGVFETAVAGTGAAAFVGNVSDAASKLMKPSAGTDVILYQKTGLGNGNQANNPWLQELPDPISKVCWDNYFAILPSYADKLKVTQGNVIEVKVGNVSIKGPVLLQPAMADNTIAVAVGYGRTNVGKAGNGVGFNAYPFASLTNGAFSYVAAGATVAKTVDEDITLAATQTHHTMMGREIVKETTLSSWLKDAKAGNPDVLIESPYGPKTPEKLDLWATTANPEHEKPNHNWGLGIDLNACIGCGACVVACNAENNVPVVGKDEIGRAREMHWIRIDRYYTSDTTKENAKEKGLGKLSMYGEMEKPAADNPEVFFQPVMCQHCNHAPCETVCPVAATTHSSEGLNMMAYNRCVGTRYCANNCPYKVRRFNWFKYSDNEQFPYNMQDQLGKMVLNPDVVVRSRGVMEKCSMCVQRIQYGKLEAKKAGRRPGDGEIKTACAQSCPTNAIVFGDYNDKNSEVNKLLADPRSYHLLAEINVQPSVFYQTKVRNKEEGHA